MVAAEKIEHLGNEKRSGLRASECVSDVTLWRIAVQSTKTLQLMYLKILNAGDNIGLTTSLLDMKKSHYIQSLKKESLRLK